MWHLFIFIGYETEKQFEKERLKPIVIYIPPIRISFPAEMIDVWKTKQQTIIFHSYRIHIEIGKKEYVWVHDSLNLV